MSLAELFYAKQAHRAHHARLSIRSRGWKLPRRRCTVWPRRMTFLIEPLEPRLLLSATPVELLQADLTPQAVAPLTQAISPDPSAQTAAPGSPVSVDVNYDADDPTLAGLSLRVHFDSTKLEYQNLSNVLPDFLDTAPPTPAEIADDVSDLDGTPTTNKYFVMTWIDLFGDPVTGEDQWPGTVPATLFRANFVTAPGFNNGSTTINFTAAETAPGYGFSATPATITAPTQLIVSGIQTVPSGVIVSFNRPINVAPLNLYDTATAGLGPADVTLVGDVVGPVKGSVVVDDTGLSLTFLKTGGPLLPDNYTLTLRSAANGLIDRQGGLLDGNADGTTGDNASLAFTVTSSSAPVLSIPDFARGPGQAVVVPATDTVIPTGIPLRISDGSGVQSVSFSLAYDPALLTITGVANGAGLPGDATVTSNLTTSGVVQVTVTAPTGLSAGSQELVVLAADVPVSAGSAYRAKHILDLKDVAVNGGAVSVLADDGLHVNAYFGDTTGNASYSGLDANRVQRVVVNLDSGFQNLPLVDPVIVADITGNGSLAGLDATRIQQEIVGIDRLEIPPLPGVIPPITFITGPDPLVSIPTDLTGAPGTVLTVPVLIDNADGLEAADFTIAYDTTKLDASNNSIRKGTILASPSSSFLANVNDATGTIQVTTSVIPAAGAGPGSLVLIDFQIKPTAPGGATPIDLRAASLNEDGLPLTVRPVVGADATDGRITIAAANAAPVVDNQTFSIPENSANGTVVNTIAVSDPDVGDTKNFTITSGTGQTVFAVAATTGVITVADSTKLDFETTPSFTIEVQVTDGCGLSDTATITINLTDVAEAPRISLPRNLVGLPGTTVTVPVLIENAAGLEAADVTIAYDTTRFDASSGSVRKGSLLSSPSSSFLANVNDAAGTIQITTSLIPPAGPGGGSLVEIDFQIKANAPGGPTALDLRSASLNEGEIALATSPVTGPDATDGLLTIQAEATGEIRGVKFNDLDGDGVRETGDLGLPGWTIFLDADLDGVLDAGETQTVTDATGAYSFVDLAPGTYRVAEALQAGWTATAPATGFQNVTVTAGETATADFGNFELGTISGIKFEDLDGDGVQDPSEAGLPGWTIQLDLNNDGTVDATTTTDAAGAYSFGNLSPGTHAVREVLQPGWVQTTPEFTVVLSPANEVQTPPVNSPASGYGFFSLGDTSTLAFDINFTPLLGATTGAHIHRGAPGVNGAVIYNLGLAGLTSPLQGTTPFNASDLADLNAGNLYANVHSTVYPGGEIRGQILPGTAHRIPMTSGLNATARNFGNQNLPPELDTIGNRTVNEEEPLAFTVSATDPSGDPLVFNASGLPSGALFDPETQTFSWTPSETQGPGVFNGITFTVSDDHGNTDSETVTITVQEVNLAPTLAAIADQAVDEQSPLSVQAQATDPDLPANALSFSLDQAPAGAAIDAATGLFSWTPTEAQGAGQYDVIVRVTDDGTPNLFDTEAFRITVTEINQAPTLDAIGDQAVDELTLLSFTATASDPDLPPNTLTFSLDEAPAGASIDGTSGLFTWTSTEAQGPGQYDVIVRVTDDGTPSLFDTEAFRITVAEINQAPVLAAVGDRTVAEGTPLTIQLEATDADLPTNVLTFSASGLPDGATFDAPTGLFQWTPSEAPGGPNSFFDVFFEVSDGQATDSELVRITVTEINQAPTLDAVGDQAVDEETLLSFTATASDPDLPPNTLTFSLGAGAPAGASITPAGLFTWTPDESQGPGVYPVTLRVTDDGSPVLDDSETFNITVTESNQAPALAAVGDRTVAQKTPLAIQLEATDADLPPNVLTFSASGLPDGATFDAPTGLDRKSTRLN